MVGRVTSHVTIENMFTDVAQLHHSTERTTLFLRVAACVLFVCPDAFMSQLDCR
jgi:hypothetical protein